MGDMDLKKLQDNWQAVLQAIREKENVTDISFHTWLQNLEAYAIEDGILYVMYTESADRMSLSYIGTQYGGSLIQEVENITGTRYRLQIVLQEEVKSKEEEKAKRGKISTEQERRDGWCVYDLIHSEEVRDYYKEHDPLDTRGKIRLLSDVYAPVKDKLAYFGELAELSDVRYRRDVLEMKRLYEAAIHDIENPPERTVYVGDYNEESWTFGWECDDNEDMISWQEPPVLCSSLEEIRSTIIQSRDPHVEPCQTAARLLDVEMTTIRDDGGSDHGIGFHMEWFEGRFEIMWLYLTDEWLDANGFDREWFRDLSTFTREVYPLPFEDGTKVRLMTPDMGEPVEGYMDVSMDYQGTWYQFVHRDKIGADRVFDLENDPYFSLRSGYVGRGRYIAHDWMERCGTPAEDAYSLMRVEEVRDAWRTKDALTVMEKESLIIGSYASLSEKKTCLGRLIIQAEKEEQLHLSRMKDLYERALSYATDPKFPALYVVAESGVKMLDFLTGNDLFEFVSYGLRNYGRYEEVLAFFDRERESIAPEEDEAGYSGTYHVDLHDIGEGGKPRKVMEFEVGWIRGSYEIWDFTMDGEYIRDHYEIPEIKLAEWRKDRSIKAWRNTGYELPYEDGAHVRITLPGMVDVLEGYLFSGIDGKDDWWHWLCEKQDGLLTGEGWRIDLSDRWMASRYNPWDWIERA